MGFLLGGFQTSEEFCKGVLRLLLLSVIWFEFGKYDMVDKFYMNGDMGRIGNMIVKLAMYRWNGIYGLAHGWQIRRLVI